MNLGKLALLSLVTFGLSAGAPGPRPPAPNPILALACPLELTGNQYEQIRLIFKAHAKSLETKRGEARQAREALQKALGDPSSEAGQLRALAGKEASAHLEEILEDHAIFKESSAVLTPEQLGKLKELRPKRPAPGAEGPEGPEGPGREPRGFMPPPPPPFGDR